MRKTVVKVLWDKAVIMAKEIYHKDKSIKTERGNWQKGSPMWCYRQLKKAYKETKGVLNAN